MRNWRSLFGAIFLLFVIPFSSAGEETNNSGIERVSCPADLERLTSLLLRDLPSYSNRVIQRKLKFSRNIEKRNFIVTASQPELEPLNLPQIQYNPTDKNQPEQVFFTVLERQYSGNKITNIQTYHWLFLTQSDRGWQTVMMFSRFGNSQDTVPSPPVETTDGIIGQGVQLWLKDCRAGTIRKDISGR